MEVSIKANCWNGERRKVLLENQTTVKRVDVPEKDTKHVRFDPKLKAILGFGLPLMFVINGVTKLPQKSYAAAVLASPAAVKAGDAVPVMSDAVKSKILHAFDPLIDLTQALSYPIAGIMIAAGCLFIMVGNRERGMQMLQNAAIGYILVQLSPMFLQLLVGVGDSV